MSRFSLKGQRGFNRARGFTLLEVLLAFVIFSISFAVVLQIISGSIRNTMRSKQYTEVALIAQSVMDRVGLEIPLKAGGAASGEAGDYRWDMIINEYQGPEPAISGSAIYGSAPSGSADPEMAEMQLDTILIADLAGVDLLLVELWVNWGDPDNERSRRFSTVKSVIAGRTP